MQTDFFALEGPVEVWDDRLVLRIPLDNGGEQLQQVARSISFVEDDDLVVLLPQWMVQKMRLTQGAAVHVDDRWGKLNIARLM